MQLISDILDLSKIEAGTFNFVYTNVDVNETCAEIIKSMSMKVSKGVELIFEEPLPECYLYTDKNRFTQVISNFINNALKFTQQGCITLGYEQVSHQKIKFYVRDTGMGIPEEKQKSVFERFVKLNTFVQGTGLGLSICAAIAQLFEANISVESKPGKGSCFSIHIPIRKDDQISFGEDREIKPLFPTNADHNTENNENQSQETTLLIAEDIESNFLLLKTIIGNRCRILWAKNGKEAIELYRNNSVDLILLDIKMPEMNGIEALKEIRKLSADIPIIMQTAYAFDSDKDIAIEAGCTGFITKPINPVVLKQTISNYISGIIW